MRVPGTFPRTALTALAICAIAVTGGALAWACTPSAHLFAGQPQMGPNGGTVGVSGSGFVPGAPIEVRWGSASGPVVGSGTGPSFSTTASIPAGATGTGYLVATGPGTPEEKPAIAIQLPSAPDPGNPGNPGGNPGSENPGTSPGGGTVNGGSQSGSAAPGTSSGSASGADRAASGSNGRTVAGGSGSSGARDGAGAGGVDSSGIAETASGDVFADSLPGTAARRAGGSKSGAPSERSASSDLWGGFEAGKNGAGSALSDASATPENGPSGLALSLVLAGLGFAGLLAGTGAMALRRRRAHAASSHSDSD